MRGIRIILHLIRDPLPPFGWALREWIREERRERVSICVWEPDALASEQFS